jgi:hypothetical protein
MVKKTLKKVVAAGGITIAAAGAFTALTPGSASAYSVERGSGIETTVYLNRSETRAVAVGASAADSLVGRLPIPWQAKAIIKPYVWTVANVAKNANNRGQCVLFYVGRWGGPPGIAAYPC